MKKNGFALLGLAVVLFACERELQFRGGQTEPKLVLNSLVTPDAPVSVQLYESRFFLSDQGGFNAVLNAEVRLFRDEELIETLQHADKGNYVAQYQPQVGDRLRITAKAPGLEAVECSTEILSPPHIAAVNMTPISYPNENGFDLSLTLRDPAESDDYYRVSLYALSYDPKNGQYVKWEVGFSSNDMVFGTDESDIFGENDNFYFVFSDELFNGKDYSLKLKIDYISIYDESNENLFCIQLQRLTKDYYLYLRSFMAASLSNGIELGGLFAEPVQIYNNVHGGIGILGSYTSTVHEILLEKTQGNEGPEWIDGL